MSYTIPVNEPRQIRAGETALWQRILPDTPAGTWSLNYVLLGPARITIACAANGTAHEANVSAATTANWTAGNYAVTARASDGTLVLPVATLFATVEILADPAAANTTIPPTADVRPWAVQALEEVESALLSLASRTTAQATVNGQSYTLQNIAELRALRASLRSEVQALEEAARAAQGLPSPRLVYTRFSTPR
jgi:hypothetical protein